MTPVVGQLFTANCSKLQNVLSTNVKKKKIHPNEKYPFEITINELNIEAV